MTSAECFRRDDFSLEADDQIVDFNQPSRHYTQRAHYRVRSLKVTTLVDVETLYVTDNSHI